MRDDTDNVNRFFMPPEMLKKRPSKAKLKRLRRQRRIRRFIALSVIVITVAVLAVSFTNAGCDVLLAFAENYAAENMHMKLKTESITGNPLKGYTMKNAELYDMNGNIFMSAESLSLYMSLSSLQMNKLRIRNGIRHSRFVDVNFSLMDFDIKTFTAEINGDINGIPLNGTIDMGDDRQLNTINRADMNFGTGKITAVGGLFNDSIYDVHAATEGVKLKELAAIFPDVLLSEDFDGDINLTLDVTGTKENPRVFGSIDCKGRKIYGFPVERMSANYNYTPDEDILMVSNIQASALSIPIQGEITAMDIFGDNMTMKIKLDGSETNLEGLEDVIKNIPEIKTLKGKVSAFNANINGSMDTLNGLVNITSPGITYMGYTFSNIRAQMKLSEDKGNVEGKFVFENANGFIKGTIESFLRGANINLTLKIADLDIKRIENIVPDYPSYNLNGNITLSLNMIGETSRPNITGELSSNEFSIKNQKVTNPVIEFMIEDEELVIENTEGMLDDKPLTITGSLKPFPSSNPELDITAEGIMITGALNDPEFNLITTSPDIIEVKSEDIKSPDIKENVSKDENIAD